MIYNLLIINISSQSNTRGFNMGFDDDENDDFFGGGFFGKNKGFG